MMQLEVKLEAGTMEMETTSMSVTETLNKGFKSIGEHLNKLIDSSKHTSNETPANTTLVANTHQTLDDLYQKIDTVNKDLNKTN